MTFTNPFFNPAGRSERQVNNQSQSISSEQMEQSPFALGNVAGQAGQTPLAGQGGQPQFRTPLPPHLRMGQTPAPDPQGAMVFNMAAQMNSMQQQLGQLLEMMGEGGGGAQQRQQPPPQSLFGQQPAHPGMTSGERYERMTTIRTSDLYKFSGTPNEGNAILKEVDVWEFQITSQFETHHISRDRDKMMYMASAMQGTAAEWYMTLCRSRVITVDTTWQEFIILLKGRFVPVDPLDHARAQYRNLVTAGTVTENGLISFIGKFQELTTRLNDMSQENRMFDFLAALKQGRLARYMFETRERYSTVEEMITAAATYRARQQANEFVTGRALNLQYSGPYVKTVASSSGGDPMEINAMQHQGNNQGKKNWQKGQKGQEKKQYRPSPGVSEAEHARRVENSLCFTCGSAGHRAWQCPKNPGKKQQGKGHGPPMEGGSKDC